MGSVAMPKPQRGFSLMELMAVLLVVGLALGIVTVSVGHGGPEKQLYDKLDQFLIQSDFAVEHAVVSGEALGILLEPPDWQVAANPELDRDEIGWKYRWQILAEKGWQDVPNMPAVSLPPDIEIDVTINKKRWDWHAKTTDKKSPVISISPSGEITPFVLEIKHALVRDFVQHIELSEEGTIVWREAAEDEKKRDERRKK
ncbi:MAG TPA: type II secretion system minor pseudopilin GspH [Cellvibrionaceae bacterium]|nr:type II secretion system minor pseudopilin GspH [Cellvibrionaceae bacterium]HMW70327.1 type II secretion system minor pseudopilin GspH [Cellvibrionaceae bacterium]HMY39820.1 type II secretion system minor pseudopilin GspH [Marinagarivorans sp.]HNG58700.1 type II secretion system minor pseudopilin GspH [Cellvibrionaceae bacterium]